MGSLDVQVLFSYVPLLTGDPGTVLSPNQEDIESLLNSANSGNAEACIWSLEDGMAAPVLVFENAKEIFDHLKMWSENEPEKWFSLGILGEGSSYALALMPSVKMSCDRWRMAFQLKYGYPPSITPTRVFFKPLHFISSSNDSFNKVAEFLPKKIRIGFLDMKNMSNDLSKIREEDIMYLENITVSKDHEPYLKGALEQMAN